MSIFSLQRVAEDYNAGGYLCEVCSLTEPHVLRLRFWRLELSGRVWEFRRRYVRRCMTCGTEEPVAGSSAELELAPAEAGSEAAAEESTGPEGDYRGRGPLYLRLKRELEMLLSPYGAEDRTRLLERAHPGVGGILLEYARRGAHTLVRKTAALGGTASTDPAAVVRILEDELFACGWAGYTCYVVVMRAQGHRSGPASTEPSDLFLRRIGTVALKRSERGRYSLQPEVAAWIWDYAVAGTARLAERGFEPPARLRSEVEKAQRDCLHLGYAVGMEEGRYRS